MDKILYESGIKPKFFEDEAFSDLKQKKTILKRSYARHAPMPNLFPNEIKVGDVFPDILSFRRYLLDHPMTSINRDLNLIYLIRIKKDGDRTRIRASCKVPKCQARLNLSNSNSSKRNQFMVTSMENLHNHELSNYVNQLSRQTQREPSVELSDSNKKKNRRKLGSSITRPRIIETREFSVLYQYLLGKGMIVKVPKEFDPNGIYYPECFLAYTPKMMELYKKYGDVVYFGFFEGAVKNHTKDGRVHSLVTFTVVDTNLRALFVGFGFTTAYTAQNVKQLFQMFLELKPSKLPECIQLKRSKQTSVATDEMKAQGIFQGQVVYRLDDLLDQLKKGLKGGVDAANLASQTFRKLATTNSPMQFRNCLELLAFDTANKRIYDDLISCGSNLFLLDMPKRFMGLRQHNDAIALDRQISRQVCGKNYIGIVRKLRSMQSQMEKASQQPDYYEGEMEQAVGDERMKAVRTGVQKRVFTKFLENYVESLTKYSINKADEVGYRVMNMLTSEIFEVSDWICDCGEAEKTGIPCCHLLAAAKSNYTGSYLDLFNTRWVDSMAAHSHKEAKSTAKSDDE